jgi:hypothetical protein
MKIIPSIFIVLFSILLNNTSGAQMQRDQDLITLKNGYQILGYVIEQQPGKLIKVYRPEQNDTVSARMDEINKLSKIWVQTYSELKIETPQQDTLRFGRYNNKKNVFAATYAFQVRDIERNARKGVGLAYYRNFNNQYWGGVSTYIFSKQDPNPAFSDARANNASHQLIQYQFLFENKLRLSPRLQTRRLTTLLALNAGVVADFSHNTYDQTDNKFDVEHEELCGGFIFQTGLAFRINPDNNSGLMIEPGYTFYPQIVKQYNTNPKAGDGIYLGFYRQVNHLFTLKLSYFF